MPIRSYPYFDGPVNIPGYSIFYFIPDDQVISLPRQKDGYVDLALAEYTTVNPPWYRGAAVIRTVKLGNESRLADAGSEFPVKIEGTTAYISASTEVLFYEKSQRGFLLIIRDYNGRARIVGEPGNGVRFTFKEIPGGYEISYAGEYSEPCWFVQGAFNADGYDTDIGGEAPPEIIISCGQMALLPTSLMDCLVTVHLNYITQHRLGATQILLLNSSQVHMLGSTQVQQLNCTQVKMLTDDQLDCLSGPQLNHTVTLLGEEQILLLNITQLHFLSETELNLLSMAQIRLLGDVRLSYLKDEQLDYIMGIMTLRQIQLLTDDQLDMLHSLQLLHIVTILTTTEIRHLNSTQIRSLSNPQIDMLDSTQRGYFVSTLDCSEVQQLNATQVQCLNCAQIQNLSTTQLQCLTHAQQQYIKTFFNLCG